MSKFIRLKNFGKEEFGTSFPKAVAVVTSIKMNPVGHDQVLSPAKNVGKTITEASEEERVEKRHRSTIQMNIHVDEKTLGKQPVQQKGETVYLSEEDYEAIQSIIAKYI